MPSKIDTFSANSLKILDNNIEEFIDKYEYNLNILKKDKRAILGNKYHSLICSYIKGFNIDLMKQDLKENELEHFSKFQEFLKDKKENFIKTEYSFLIKNIIKTKPYFLTGRFDAIYKDADEYIIYDWKTMNLPKNAQDDLQTIVYLYCLSQIIHSDKIKMRYFSIEKIEFKDIVFKNSEIYKKRIEGIIEKYYNY